MGTSNYSDEFKRDAVQQITVRGYPVREVSRRFGGKHAFALQMDEAYEWLCFSLKSMLTFTCSAKLGISP
ncbi:hypothetical protein SuNHUV7_04850 (plasmid) [Pseudoseohaeicola sp. NH-UV-7]